MRALTYEKAMEQVDLCYPEDREAVIFYARALDATVLQTGMKSIADQLSPEIARQIHFFASSIPQWLNGSIVPIAPSLLASPSCQTPR